MALVQNPSLPRTDIQFRLGDEFVPGRWVSPVGLGAAVENYVTRLRDLEKVRFATSAVVGLTDAHRKAFEMVVEAAAALQSLGWPVNWEQNVQAILEVAEIGLQNGELVDRFQGLPEEVTLRDELALLGTVTFYKQHRSAQGAETRYKAAIFTSRDLDKYSDVVLRNVTASKRFRRQSDWLQEPSGREVRIAV